MNTLLLCICIPILFICPVLYPPAASFTAIFFTRRNKIDCIGLFLIFSASIVTSLISATITPVGDTQNYIDSFQEIQSFDFSEINLNSNDLEPFYKVYEYILYFLVGENSRLFLLITALIFNLLSTTAILRICFRLHYLELSCVIFTLYYSLVSPALGQPLFLLRSSLSLSILFLAISFRNQISTVFYILGTISIFTHYSSALIFGIFLFWKHLTILTVGIGRIAKKVFFISLNQSITLKFHLLIIVFGIILVTTIPGLVSPILQIVLGSFGESEAIASGKTKSFLDQGDVNFIDLKNPVLLLQLAISFLCFINVRYETLVKSNKFSFMDYELRDFLESLRFLGRLLITIIVFTSPLNVLPLRLGLFNFLYFPIWIINTPFIFWKNFQKPLKYLILLSLMAVLVYTFYWMPKREGGEFYIVVLDGQSLKHNLIHVIEYFCSN